MMLLRFLAVVVLSFLATMAYLIHVSDAKAGEGRTLSDYNIQKESTAGKPRRIVSPR